MTNVITYLAYLAIGAIVVAALMPNSPREGSKVVKWALAVYFLYFVILTVMLVIHGG